MICNTFSNLIFRQVLKKSSHSFHPYVEDKNGEKTFLVYVGITRLVLLFRKLSNIHFLQRRCYNKVASRQVKIPFDKMIGPQRGKAFAALAKVIEKVANPFLRNYFVPATTRVGTDLMEFYEPNTAVVVRDR